MILLTPFWFPWKAWLAEWRNFVATVLELLKHEKECETNIVTMTPSSGISSSNFHNWLHLGYRYCSLTFCLSLDSGGRPPKKRKEKKKHCQLWSSCPKPFSCWFTYRSRIVCSGHWGTVHELDLFVGTQMFAITCGKQSGDDAKTEAQISTAVVQSLVEHVEPFFPGR